MLETPNKHSVSRRLSAWLRPSASSSGAGSLLGSESAHAMAPHAVGSQGSAKLLQCHWGLKHFLERLFACLAKGAPRAHYTSAAQNWAIHCAPLSPGCLAAGQQPPQPIFSASFNISLTGHLPWRPRCHLQEAGLQTPEFRNLCSRELNFIQNWTRWLHAPSAAGGHADVAITLCYLCMSSKPS